MNQLHPGFTSALWDESITSGDLLCSEVFRISSKLSYKAGQKFGDGVRVVEQETNFGGPLVIAQRLPKLVKVA